MVVIPATRPRSAPSSRPTRRTHRRTRPAATPAPRTTQRQAAAPVRRRRRSRINLGGLIVGGSCCAILTGLTFLLSSLLGHTMLRRSQAQFEDIQARSVFAERELTRLNKELRQINTLDGLGSMSQAHQLYRDGRLPVIVATVQEKKDAPKAQ